MFSDDEHRFNAAARRFHFEALRGNPDFAELLFTLQAANANHLGHLRGMRSQTRELFRILEAQRPGSQGPPGRDTSARGAR